MNKEYGKLTANQFRQLIDILPKIQEAAAELATGIAGMASEKFDSLEVDDFAWHDLYELPMAQHVAVVLHVFNLRTWHQLALSAPDPSQVLLDGVPQTYLEGNHEANGTNGELLGACYSLINTLKSVALYQRSLSSLVEEIRRTGDPVLVCKAVRVDRTVVACPSVAKWIARAELRQDKDFFHALGLALNGPTKNHMKALEKMRFAFAVLREQEITDLNVEGLERLFVEVLGAYSPSPTTADNLQATYRKSKKISTI